jgi:D-alanyl-D-alanine carboxypeptidase/D-alanyl-D-alanine-endopeptidase (penicillin-binding protein 4)
MSRFRRRPLVVFILSLVFFQLVPVAIAQQAADQWSARIAEIINGPDYRHANWGVLVVDADSGETVYAHNAERLLRPASVTKIFAIAAALAALGADYRFETPVYRRGELVDTTLKGDLILVAQGDLTMGGRTDADGHLAFKDQDHTYANGVASKAELTDTDPLAGLKALARQVAASGIRQVDGDVLIDDRLFERTASSGSGPPSLTPMVINDNVVDVIITPGAKPGEPATVRMRPETNYVRMDASVVTTAADTPTRVEVRGGGGGERFTVRGKIAVNARPQVRIYAVDEPTTYARALFIETLRREGVSVAASPLQPGKAELPEKESYARLTRVGVYTSPPFAEVVKVTLKVSHNLYASAMPLLIAVKHSKKTLADGLRLVRKYLAEYGVDVSTISFAGGAGGAGADFVTPRATVQLLQALAKRPYYKVFEDALPVLGVDGTLADTVGPNSPARGMVKAKTGTYFWSDLLNDRSLLTSKALAGVMTTARGRRLMFAMFVNNVPLPRGVTPSREGRVLGQLCEVIYQQAPGR